MTKGEILFVVTVLVVTWAISWAGLKIGQMKARDAQRKADVELVGRALQRYWEDYQEYPSATASGQIVSCGRGGQQVCRWGQDALVDNLEVVYLARLPQDPLAHSGRFYAYQTTSQNRRFKLYVALEYSKDPARQAYLTVKCGPDVQCNWYVEN